jgi:hypothetical protein
MIEGWAEEAEKEFEEYVAENGEFDLHFQYDIDAALRRIDRARRKLIETQNDLVILLRGSNNCTREIFGQFYAAGGVTAADWQAHLKSGLNGREPKCRGQLRVVK